MKIRILPSATEDLKTGKNFYEEQRQGLGQYFMDSLFSDIDSLGLYGGIHAILQSVCILIFCSTWPRKALLPRLIEHFLHLRRQLRICADHVPGLRRIILQIV